MKDWRGTEIGVGDTVLYAVTQSSMLTINEAVVTGFGVVEAQKEWKTDPDKTIQVEWKRSSGGNYRDAKKRRTLTEPRNLTVIEKATPPDNIYGGLAGSRG